MEKMGVWLVTRLMGAFDSLVVGVVGGVVLGKVAVAMWGTACGACSKVRPEAVRVARAACFSE